jgi:hypothetical protein
VVAGLGGFEVFDAAAEEGLFRERFDEDDAGGDEDGGLAGVVGDGDFDQGLGVILLAALEAQAALGHVLAGDDFVAALGMTNAGGVGDFDARVPAAIGRRGGVCCGNGGRHGEDGGARLAGRVDSGGGVSRGIVGLCVERRSGRGGRRDGNGGWRLDGGRGGARG